MKEMRATLLFALLCLSAFTYALAQQPSQVTEQSTVLLLLNGAACVVIVLLVVALWIWDITQNEPTFRFRKRVILGMFAPFTAAFAIWLLEYLELAARHGPSQYFIYGVPLLLGISGFEMTGLPDGARIHPLLGAYDPKSSHHHPLPWLTRDFAFYGSVGLTGLAALLINVFCRLGFQTSCNEVFARSIESFVNSAAAVILGLGLLRILNAHSFDVVSSWPAYLLFGDALFQWGAMWDPYHVLQNDRATIVPAVSLCIKILFIGSLWQILAAVYSRAQEGAKVMISYRRDEALSITSRIYEHFVAKFGDDRVFRDIDSIPLGIKFRDYIEKIVSTCAVVLVVIGPKWLAMEDKQGKRKLDNPDDLLRLEIALALQKGISIIPILVAGATMPLKTLLPADIQELIEHQGMIVSEDPHFKADMERLIREVQNIIAKHGRK